MKTWILTLATSLVLFAATTASAGHGSCCGDGCGVPQAAGFWGGFCQCNGISRYRPHLQPTACRLPHWQAPIRGFDQCGCEPACNKHRLFGGRGGCNSCGSSCGGGCSTSCGGCGSCGTSGGSGCGTCGSGCGTACGSSRGGSGLNFYWLHGGSYKPLCNDSRWNGDTRNYLRFRIRQAAHGCTYQGRYNCCSNGGSCGGCPTKCYGTTFGSGASGCSSCGGNVPAPVINAAPAPAPSEVMPAPAPTAPAKPDAKSASLRYSGYGMSLFGRSR